MPEDVDIEMYIDNTLVMYQKSLNAIVSGKRAVKTFKKLLSKLSVDYPDNAKLTEFKPKPRPIGEDGQPVKSTRGRKPVKK